VFWQAIKGITILTKGFHYLLSFFISSKRKEMLTFTIPHPAYNNYYAQIDNCNYNCS